ncbi:MAG: cytochrome c3 family protein [Acidobacteriota bacterium]
MSRSLKIIALLVIIFVPLGFFIPRATNRPTAPKQPIEYNHWQHVVSQDGPQLDCDFCHENADKSPHATIPNISTCMGCHVAVKTESPEIQKLAEFYKRKEQPKWVRVYYFEREANVFFSHKPHLKAKMECKECHGEVTASPGVKREVNMTMSWCLDCHRQRQASIDCYVCHR